MNEQTITPATEVSFKVFLLKNKRNRTILKLAAVAIVVQFAIFKYLYPYASFIHGDSFSYIKAADQNLSINTYLIGYSKFLRLFSVFAKSDFALVAFQYLFIQCSIIYLLFTLFYFYKPSKVTQIVLLIIMVFNPLFLHLANLVSSDGFFLALSMTWFTLLLWIIHRPSKQIIIWHSIILFISFTVRYNAMIYPFISFGAFGISQMPVRKRLAGIGVGFFLCCVFVVFTSYQYKKLTGYWQYSPFSGWQLTNNAMYSFRYVDSLSRKPVPEKFQRLDNMIREYFDSTRNYIKYPQEALIASTVYMWTKRLTLYKYRDSLFRNDTIASELKKWASMGPFYKEYGQFIIKRYPFHFVRHFLWPNAMRYYAPPIEFLEVYNAGKNEVSVEAKNWFNYKSTKVKTRTKDKKVWVLSFYPIVSGIINVAMLCTLMFYLILKGWNYKGGLNNAILVGGSFWLLNAGFTIFASSAALRFQSFPIMLATIFVALLIDWMVQLMKIMEDKPVSIETQKFRGAVEGF